MENQQYLVGVQGNTVMEAPWFQSGQGSHYKQDNNTTS
jgi:hypothetical protein